VATASGDFIDGNGNTETDTDTDDANYYGSDPSIVLVKSGSFQDESGDGYADVGETIGYSFLVTNDGNVTLTNVTVGDINYGYGTLGAITCDPVEGSTLLPGGTMSCSAIYTIVQADIDAGLVENRATATGTPPVGVDVSDEDSESVLLPQNPAIKIVKTGAFDAGADGYADPDELITYTFVVTNVADKCDGDGSVGGSIGDHLCWWRHRY
jgi:hypothetical protein